jgi:NAD(P)-dependent dehydrogenase (short-subunit alcohol dehydrogenase family)
LIYLERALQKPANPRRRVKVTPLGSFGVEHDIKGAAAFFASEASRHITGQAIAIDGGGSAVILN